MESPSLDDDFRIEWHGDAVVITPAKSVESMRWDLIEQAGHILIEPINEMQVPLIVFDLCQVDYFGSVFIALLLKCHKLARDRGGELVLAGANPAITELLSKTSLDTLWAMYDSRQEALDMLGS